VEASIVTQNLYMAMYLSLACFLACILMHLKLRQLKNVSKSVRPALIQFFPQPVQTLKDMLQIYLEWNGYISNKLRSLALQSL